MDSKDLSDLVVEALEDVKAKDIVKRSLPLFSRTQSRPHRFSANV